MSTGVFRENIEHTVKVNLTVAEQIAACEEMTKAYGDKAALEVEKKAEADKFKTLIEGEEARIKRNGALLHKGCIEITMDCERIKDFEANTVSIVRLDNGEVVESRELNEDEQQMEISDDDGPEDPREPEDPRDPPELGDVPLPPDPGPEVPEE